MAGSEVKILDVQPATSQRWDGAWGNCRYATYFHSREWAEIWAASSHGKMACGALLFEFSDGAEAVFPFSTRKLLYKLQEEYITSAGGTFGGWLSQDPLTHRHAQLMLEDLSKRKSSFSFRANPYDGLSSILTFANTVPDVTHTLDLRAGFDTVYRGISKGHKSAAKKASKSGVLIREADSNDDWNRYYAVYEDSLLRWGSRVSSRYSRHFFSTMSGVRSSRIRLWLAEYRGEVIAGAVCLYSNTHVAYWHGAALAQYFQLRGPNLLIEEAIRNACANGHHWFDFNPSGGHAGPRSFKEHFGAVPLDCPLFNARPSWLRFADRLSGRLSSLRDRKNLWLRKIEKASRETQPRQFFNWMTLNDQ